MADRGRSPSENRLDENEKKPVTTFLVVISVSFLLVVGFGIFMLFAPDREIDGRLTPETGPETTEGETPAIDRLVVTEWNFDAAAAAITGTVANNTDREFLMVEVFFDLYDADDNHVGVVSETYDGLILPRQEWNFTIEVDEPAVHHVTLNNVAGTGAAPGTPPPS